MRKQTTRKQQLRRRTLRGALALATSGCLVLSSGCAYSNRKRDEDRKPVIQTGVGAAILWPNAAGPGAPPGSPALPPAPGVPSSPHGSSTQGPSTRDQSSRGEPQASGARSPTPEIPPARAGNVTLIGGNESDVTTHKEIHQQPLPLKWLMTPFAIVALPFVKLYEAVAGDDDEPEVAAKPSEAQQANQQVAHEQAKLDALERELARRPGASHPAPPSRTAPAVPVPAPRTTTPPRSIAEELAALRRGARPGSTLPSPPAPGPAPQGLAHRVEDRDHNGRPDHWVYREQGVLVRELFDENGDGAADRTIEYDPATGERSRVEEDADFDGRPDAFAEFRGGDLVRRRGDANHDGVLDTWSFYRQGKLARQEQDLDGDGFRDRVGFYQAGQLTREEEDTNGDGRPDRVTLYDAQERVLQRDEDRDGDGLVDMRSYYSEGRLTRRELVGEDEQASVEQSDLVSASWETGDEAPAPTREERR